VNVVKMVSLAFQVFRDHQVHVGCQVKVLWEERLYQVLLDNQDLQDHP
jgi:trans-2-enoyl-CoA reductase